MSSQDWPGSSKQHSQGRCVDQLENTDLAWAWPGTTNTCMHVETCTHRHISPKIAKLTYIIPRKQSSFVLYPRFLGTWSKENCSQYTQENCPQYTLENCPQYTLEALWQLRWRASLEQLCPPFTHCDGWDGGLPWSGCAPSSHHMLKSTHCPFLSLLHYIQVCPEILNK